MCGSVLQRPYFFIYLYGPETLRRLCFAEPDAAAGVRTEGCRNLLYEFCRAKPEVLMEMEWNFIVRLCVAGLCGTVIGLDREYRVKDAGFRTHFLVALGSALMMIVSQYGFEDFLATHDGLRLAPSRIAAQVVSGIGFIGAGAIIFHRQIVRGLTTAASLWAIAGVGMATGAGMYGVAAAATVLTLVGLEVLNLIFGGLGAHRTALVFSAVEREAIQEALELLRTRGYGIVSYELESERTASGIIYRANLLLQARKSRKGDAFVELLQQDPRILVERIA